MAISSSFSLSFLSFFSFLSLFLLRLPLTSSDRCFVRFMRHPVWRLVSLSFFFFCFFVSSAFEAGALLFLEQISFCSQQI